MIHEFIEDALSRDPAIRYWGLSCAFDVWEQKPNPRHRKLLRAVCRLMLLDPDSGNRERAADLLAEVGNRSDLHAFVRLQDDPHYKVRCSALAGMASLGGRKMVPRIKASVADQHPIVRRYCYLEVSELIFEDAIPWLMAHRETEKDDLARIGIDMALAHLGDTSADEKLVEFAKSPVRFVCRPARESLIERGLPIPPNSVADEFDAEQARREAEPYPTYFNQDEWCELRRRHSLTSQE